MAGHVLAERSAFVATLRDTDPAAPTLCGDWDAAHLSAHLVLRERSLVELGGRLPVGALQRRAHGAIDNYVSRHSYTELVDRFGAGPPRYSLFAVPAFRDAVNLLEYVVHHEDVRRAVPGVGPRDLAPSEQSATWSRLRFTAALTLRQVPQSVRLVSPDHGEINATKKNGALVTVTGDPVELALVIMGRQRVAQVKYDGPPAEVASFSGARIAI